MSRLTSKKHKKYTEDSEEEAMSQKNLIIGLAGIILVIIIATFFVARGRNLFSGPVPTPIPSKPTPFPTPTPIQGDTIMFTGLRFTPQKQTETLGHVVNFANFGDDPIEIVADDTSGEGIKLSVGVLKAGDTSQFVKFDKAGTYGYHLKSDPTQKGIVIVQ